MIEKLFQIIAPDVCVVCTDEGQCLCTSCSNELLIRKKPACPLCNKLNESGKTCNSCYSKSKLRGASISYRYEGVVKELVWAMKYENKRSIARYFSGKLDKLDGIVCYVPSDGKTRRMRGYDQAEIIARSYAKSYSLPFSQSLIRIKHTRQVGKGRAERIENTKDNFVVLGDVLGKEIILVDDVITTGATVSECARVLKRAGAKSVWAIAIAKK